MFRAIFASAVLACIGVVQDALSGAPDAIATLGAPPFDQQIDAILPDAMPWMIETDHFALEQAAGSSLILVLTPVGGLGRAQKVAFDLFQHQIAASIILSILIIVVIMERLTDGMLAKVS